MEGIRMMPQSLRAMTACPEGEGLISRAHEGAHHYL